jgi:hypothetical protein
VPGKRSQRAHPRTSTHQDFLRFNVPNNLLLAASASAASYCVSPISVTTRTALYLRFVSCSRCKLRGRPDRIFTALLDQIDILVSSIPGPPQVQVRLSRSLMELKLAGLAGSQNERCQPCTRQPQNDNFAPTFNPSRYFWLPLFLVATRVHLWQPRCNTRSRGAPHLSARRSCLLRVDDTEPVSRRCLLELAPRPSARCCQ